MLVTTHDGLYPGIAPVAILYTVLALIRQFF